MKSNDCLIGYTGFVGTTLQKQRAFQSLYRSTNISDIVGASFDTVVCAGAPAQKWIANRDPEQDCANIDSLIERLKTIQCHKFILISTVDVFKSPIEVYEDTVVEEEGLHAYGLDRLRLEMFVQENFSDHLIVRLPGLVGAGLRKNIIYDFLNNNNLEMVDSRNIFQFYPMCNLWFDIQVALNNGLDLLHLTAEPVSVSDVAQKGFAMNFSQSLEKPLAKYDMRTRHAELFEAGGAYQYTAKETLQAIRCYAQSEIVKAD